MFRFIDTGGNNGAMNMAIDEALLVTQNKNKTPPIIRVYQFIPPTLSIGYFQSMEREVDIEHCRQLGFDFVRRPTGGRAVLHDRELTYSAIIAYPNEILNMSLLDSFRYLSRGIIRAIEILGGTAYFSSREDNEINSPSCFAAPTFSDILINRKKVVGSAQMRNSLGLLQHGSILYEVNIPQIFYCLKMDEKAREKVIASATNKITSLTEALRKRIGYNDIKEALKRGMEEVLGEEVVPDEVKENEMELARDIYSKKYSTEEWNFKR